MFQQKGRVPCKLNNEQNEQAPDVRTLISATKLALKTQVKSITEECKDKKF